MIFKKMIFGVAALAALASGVQAAESLHGRERRWDFSCRFENDNTCRALATIYTRRELERPGHHDRDDAPGTQWSYLNRFAVSCEEGGMIYADGASVRFHGDNLIISAANGGRPRLILDLPLGDHHGGSGVRGQSGHEDEQTEATLLLPNGDRIRGECEYRHHEVH
jgi:hypothetical protein